MDEEDIVMNVLSHQCQIEQEEQAFFNKTHSSFDKASKANCYDQQHLSFSDTRKTLTLNSISHLCVLFHPCDFPSLPVSSQAGCWKIRAQLVCYSGVMQMTSSL